MSFRTKHVEKIAGIFIIAVFVASVFLITFVSREQEWFAERYILKAVFDHGGDIQQDSAVTMEGIDIGKVKRLSFNEENKIEVVLSVKARFKKQIRKDSYISIVRTTLFGSPVLDISLGSPAEKVLEDEDYLPVRQVPEATMKDIINVTNNLVQVMRDFANPQGPYQKVLKNLEGITDRLNKSESSAWAMLSDDGKMYRDSREILASLNEYMKANNSLPIELTKKSQLMISLSETLDKQTDIFVKVAAKMDIICDRLVKNQGMAGAMISDKELYTEMLTFMRDSKVLLDSLNQLSNELKLVIPQLPGLIESAKRGMKDMEEVMESVKRLPFIRSGVSQSKAVPPIEIEGRIERK